MVLEIDSWNLIKECSSPVSSIFAGEFGGWPLRNFSDLGRKGSGPCDVDGDDGGGISVKNNNMKYNKKFSLAVQLLKYKQCKKFKC